MVNPARSQATLRNLESSSFTQQHIRDRNPNVFVGDFAMAVGRVVVAEHRQQSLDLDSGSIEGHQDHGLLLVLRSRRISLSHEDGDFATRITGARRPPFAPVDYIFLAITNNARLNIS